MSPKHHILTNKSKLLRTVMLKLSNKKHKSFQIHTCATNLSTEREVITGKSHTEAFMY